ncbi:MAG: hypothetical protein PHQ18_02205 [Patescibacteria group bacterium]|nr:hypothetical protein [Patescibacteria group bacterium]
MQVTYRLREKTMYMVRKFFPLLSFFLLTLSISGIIYLVLGNTKDPGFLTPVYIICLVTFPPTTVIFYFDSRSKRKKEEDAERREQEELDKKEEEEKQKET